MRNLLAVMLLALPLALAAQSPITITRNDMPEPGDTLRVSNADFFNINTTSTGANHVWDYSTLVPRSQDRSDYVYSLQTIYAFYFFGVNQYGTKIGDTLGGGPFTFTNVYNFYRSANADFRAEGVGFQYQGAPLAAYYDDEDELYKFPLDYLDRDTTSFHFRVDLGTGLSFSQTGTRFNYVDGWGVVITPYDSIACLRLVSETDGIDSVTFNGFNFAIPNQQRSIKFLANGVHIPILEISGRTQMGQFQPQQVRYRDEYRNLVAAPEPHSSQIRFYPNPASNVLGVENTIGTAFQLEVRDMQGRLIDQVQVEQSHWQQDISHYAPGIYLMSVRNLDGQLLETAKIFVGSH